MSLVFTDGFELYSALADFAIKWGTRVASTGFIGGTTGSANVSVATGRFSIGQAVRSQVSVVWGGVGTQTASAYVDTNLGADYQTLFVGTAFNPATLRADVPYVWLYDLNATLTLDLRITSGLLPYLTRNGTTLCTSSRALTYNAWVYFEIAANISSTAGWAELWMDGVLVASYYGTGSSRATANGNTQTGLASVRTLRLGHTMSLAGGWSSDVYFDDLYVCSSAGTSNTNVLGDSRVATLLPTGAGNYAQWTRGGSDSGSNYGQVDEAVSNGDTDYVSSGTVGQVDTYTYADLPASAQTVKGVVAQFVARKSDAGLRRVAATVRQGGSDYLSPTEQNLTASYLASQLLMDTNPATGVAWTVSDVNALEAGPKVTY